MQYTELELKQRIKARMGGGRRLLEFAEQNGSGEFDSLSEAIQQALDLFNKYVFRRVFEFIAQTSELNIAVDFSDDADLLRVIRVDFTAPAEQTTSVEDVFGLSNIVQGGYGMGGRRGRMAPAGRTTYGDVAFWKSQREALGRQMSKEPDWLWDEQNRRLALYLPNGPYEITYEKAYPHTLATLPRNYEADFLKAAEGYARQILADIRGKFGSQIPGPTGGTETDAESQRQRGQQLVQEIEEQLRNLPLEAGVEFG